VFDNNNVKYDIILSTNFLSKTGIKLNYSEGNMLEWFDCTISLFTPGGLYSKESNAMEDMFHIQVKDKIFSEDWLECFAMKILDAKYETTDVAEVVKGLTHLNAHQKGLTICTMIEIVQSGFLDGVLGFPVQNSTNSQIPGV
jgi:hypothetical protein